MPCTIRTLTPHGLAPVGYTAHSLKDAAEHEPDGGVYTTASTVDSYKVIKLTAHLDRLQQSAARAGIDFGLNHDALRRALRETIDAAGYGNVRFRITIPPETPDEPIFSVEPFAGHPAHIYIEGVRCITAPNSARADAVTKSTDWMHDRDKLAKPEGIHEVLLRDANDHLLEGTGSNFYAVMNDELRTAGEGVLEGISRQIVFAVAPTVLTVNAQPVRVEDVPVLTEAFISSSSRGIVPVVEIDGQTIGTGKPGPRTEAIRGAYLEWVSANLETI